MLNRFDARDPLHQLNRTWLRERYGIRTHQDVGELSAVIVAREMR
jgi:hypothetical protein